MKRTLAIALLCLTGNLVFSQDKEAAEKMVEEGIAYHDKGDYEGAIDKYEKALKLDKNNLLALAEKGMSQLSIQKYEESINTCRQAIEIHAGNPGLKTVYVTYGNAYDALKKTDQSIEVYNEGLKQFPDFYMLHFNKGISLASVKKNDEAILCFQKSVQCNPKHPGSHNALARLNDSKNKRIPALLAYCRFMVLEPQSKRAKENLGNILTILNGNVEKTGRKSVTIHVNPDSMKDSSAYGRPSEDYFGIQDILISMDAALDYDKKNKNKSEVELFVRKFGNFCGSLKESRDKNFGFFWEYYTPYFIEMHEKNLVETFSYLVFATSENEDAGKWLKSHKSAIDDFYSWSKNFQWKKS